MDINIDQIDKLLDLMKQHDVTELEYQLGDGRLHVRRGVEVVTTVTAAAPAPQPVPIAQPAAATTAAATAPAAAAGEPASALTPIKSPMVGTFYTAPSPDSPVFVKLGDTVRPDSTVCIIEAMKVMNEIKAGVSGKISKLMVENGKPVEFGQVLFLVE